MVLVENPRSLTGHYLSGRREIPLPARRRAPGGATLVVCGARQNNLKGIDVAIPLANILTVALVRARRETVLQVEQQRLADKSGISNELLGNSHAMLELKSRIGRVARASRVSERGSVIPSFRGERG